MLGSVLVDHRRVCGISQSSAAAALGVSRSTYGRLEGSPGRLSVCQLRLLADLFGVPAGDLLRGVGPGRVQSYSVSAFRCVLLYVLCRVGGMPSVSPAVLRWLLYFIDFDYYERYEENLIGASYVKGDDGVVVVQYADVVAGLMASGDVAVVAAGSFSRLIALAEPDLRELSAVEVVHVDGVIARLSSLFACGVDGYGRGDIPYRASGLGSVIPYEMVFYRSDGYSVRDYSGDPL